MDMNDILNQWDKIKAQEKLIAREMRNEKAFEKQIQEQNQRKINPMEQWLRIYGTIDKDKIAEEHERSANLYDRNYLINMKPEARLDLHGLRQDEALERLNYFIGDCVRRKIKKVIVIHGKGIHTTGTDPVLGELVRRFIESDKRCGTSGHPKNKAEGGTGATWILLKY